ncbi:hypothetical protein BDW66DRAFT_137535 [Aspergillus desertorum]
MPNTGYIIDRFLSSYPFIGGRFFSIPLAARIISDRPFVTRVLDPDYPVSITVFFGSSSVVELLYCVFLVGFNELGSI